jgi:ATP synthase protein I
MSEPSPPEAEDPSGQQLDATIARVAARKAKARARRGRSLWAQASRVGTVGWLIAVPIVLGAFGGHLLDLRLGTGITWALAGMVLGIAAGGYALWRLGFDMREEDST